MKTTKDLIKYIKVQTKRGVSRNDITNTLKEHKWSDEAIIDGYKKAKETNTLTKLIIIILILIIGGGIFYGWKNGLLEKYKKETVEIEKVEIIDEVKEVEIINEEEKDT